MATPESDISEYVLFPGDTQVMPLPGGVKLGYAVYGHTGESTNPVPLLYLHGTPGSRLEARSLHKWARSRRTTIIAPERPGMGTELRFVRLLT